MEDSVLSFAVVDNVDWPIVATWIVSRVTPTEAASVNAVVLDTQADPRADQKLRALTRGRAAVLTAGSARAGLPLTGDVLSVMDLARLAAATEAQQERVLEAVRAFALRPNPKTGKVPKAPRKIVLPEFPTSPRESDFSPQEGTPPGRALAAANYLARVWSIWLQTEEDRRRRAFNSRGEPWMMPDHLADPEIAELPREFAETLSFQPVI